MRTLLLLLIASLASAGAQAQTLSTNLQKYKEICLDLRDAVKKQSVDSVEDVDDRLLKFDRSVSHTGIGGFHAEADYEGVEAYAGHILFERSFLKAIVDVLWDVRQVNYIPNHLHRGSGGGVCTEQKVIAAGGTLSCTIPQCYGQCELVVVAEKSAPLTLSVLINESPEEEQQEDGVCEKIWELPDGTKEDLHFSITNNSEEALSCIIISN